ncbi:amidohydrolase [Arthrobacter sp. H14]|uniref:amidohydrolase n=1 Tax=Arthrobacter sp. H14 TaxID=1312959 RepID=UPI0004BBAF09|nr:amidohydrolase [Arthrobacter sp. H14]
MSSDARGANPKIELTGAHTQKMHDLYRQLHANPELSMQEHRTAEIITERLEALGVENFSCGGTGVVGILRNGEGPVVGFRADTDGLPIKEDTGLEYASAATGTLPDGTDVPVMHGCGHDTHVTGALATAELLADARDSWSGTVVFIFQPGEETAAGAKAMVDDGLWEKAPLPEVVLGQHVMPEAAGSVHIRSGNAMSMADSWKVTVHGRGGHGSQPQDTVDPIVLGAHMVVRIQSIVAREVDPRESAVVTIGTFHAGLKENIIPASAEFTLNVRTFSQDVRDKVLHSLRRIIKSEADSSGAPEPQIEEISTFPACWNDPEATAGLLAEFRQSLGVDNVVEGRPQMGSEDFGSLAEAIGVPSVYWFFGGHPPELLESGRTVPMNHSPQFAPVMEPTLSTGVRAATTAILSRVGLQRP